MSDSARVDERSFPLPWSIGPVQLDFRRPVIMAVLNVTPDSFSDGGELAGAETVLERARREVDAGAQLLDVGGESTRPGAEAVTATEEIRRVVPAIEALVAARLDAAISIDTQKAEVAHAALRAGAHLVNDVSALRDTAMARTVADANAFLCLTHMRGTPRTMQRGPIVYEDLVADVDDFLRERSRAAALAGVKSDRVMVDPGIGFGKRLEHNLELTRCIEAFTRAGQPVLYGPSRKRFLGEITGRDVHDRDRATAAACAIAAFQGAHVFRVHHTAACIDAIRVGHRVAFP